MNKENLLYASRHSFLGVPIQDFENAGKEQLNYLLAAGLSADSKLIDIGCGVLRAGYWIIHFLNPCCYFGIEPHKKRLETGISLLEKEVLEDKKPAFDTNCFFDTSIFNEKFDFFLSYSIWTHASKSQIKIMLDNFIKDSGKGAKFLTTYLPSNDTNDYMEDKWFGTSHESDIIGCIYHSEDWIYSECKKRNLLAESMGQDKTHGQHWLQLKKKI